MGPEKRRSDRDILRDCWSRWTKILTLFAQRRSARQRVDPEAYAALREEVIEACRLCAVRARLLAGAYDSEAALYTSMEDIVKPWLDLHVIERTDTEILTSLLEHYREVEQELTVRSPKRAGMRNGGMAVAVIVGGLVSCGLILLIAMAMDRSMFDSVRDHVNWIWLVIHHSDVWQIWYLPAGILVMTALFLVSLSTKMRV